MKQIRKVNRIITKSDNRMEKECNMKIERISVDELKSHLVFGEVIQVLINAGMSDEIFELHYNGRIEILWLNEDFGLRPGTDQEGNRVYGITVNTNLDEGLIGAFVRILTRNKINHQITHAIYFDGNNNPIIRPAIVQVI